LTNLLKNKALLYKNYNIGDPTINPWPYWQLEENIKIINKMNEEENKERKKQEEAQQKQQQQQSNNMNPGSYMNSMSSMASKFKR
jgi:hypothetical protein